MPPAYRLLATDYDGTIASEGTVEAATMISLETLRRKGIYLVLVTGRIMKDLRSVFPQLSLFHLVVAENGCLLHDPAKKTERLLAAPPPVELTERLRQEEVPHLTCGRVIIATRRPADGIVSRLLQQNHPDLQIIYNKEAVMVMPRHVDKGTGLAAALAELNVAAAETVGIGDAENDLDFLVRCGMAVAVGNGLPAVKEKAHLVTCGMEGAGVREAVAALFRGI